ncbi:MAG: NUDIX domain-containing protein [Acidimicrobiia bacterium]
MLTSAGLLPFRVQKEVLIAHPGGPFFARKDARAWSLIKGEVQPGEDAKDAAAREFAEETGWECPIDGWIELGSVRLRSGKTVLGWAVEADFDPGLLNPGHLTMFWHGRNQSFPEIDQVRWCEADEARRLLNPAQTPFIDRLLRTLGS